LCNTSGYAFIANTTVYLHCELANVAKVRIVAEYRLQLCEARVYATNGVVDCEAPPNIPNGQVFVSSTTFESQANYTCMDGYRLIGHDKLLCTVKGIWEPAAPMCYDMATLRELRANSTESRAGLAALGVVLAFILVFVVFRFSKTTKTVSISEKVRIVLFPSPPSTAPPGLIYVTPSMLTNPQDSVVYYASSMPFAKMEIPPHLLSLKHLPNGNIQATMPIGMY
ncbi:hypothetical protein GCK32_019118, partial [Trichostrongylus colubriformis]